MPAPTAWRTLLVLCVIFSLAVCQIPGGQYHGYTDKAYTIYPKNITYWDQENTDESDNSTLARGGSFTLGQNSTLTAYFPFGGPWILKVNLRDYVQGPSAWFSAPDVNDTVYVTQALAPYNFTWNATVGETVPATPVLQGFIYLYSAFNCCTYGNVSNGFYSDWVNFTNPALAPTPSPSPSAIPGIPGSLPPPPSPNSGGGLSSGAKIGLGVGLAVGIAVLVAVAILLLWLRRRKQSRLRHAAAALNRTSYTSPQTVSGQLSTMTPQGLPDEKRDSDYPVTSSMMRHDSLQKQHGELQGSHSQAHELPGSPAVMSELDSGEKSPPPDRGGAVSPVAEELNSHLSAEPTLEEKERSPKEESSNVENKDEANT